VHLTGVPLCSIAAGELCRSAKKGESMNAIAFIIAAIVIVIGIYLGRRAMERPKRISLDPDERRIGEMYGKTRDVTLGGFTAAGSAIEGKVILTSKRLIYMRYDEKKHAFAIEPNELISVQVGEKGFLKKTPTLSISFTRGPRRKPKVVTWEVPEKATSAGNLLLFMSDKTYDNPNTAYSFAFLLEKWKTGNA